MKKGQFSESVIFQVLKEAEAGVPVPELCRKHGMSSASFYKWRAKYGGMDVSHMKRLKVECLQRITMADLTASLNQLGPNLL